MPIVNSLLDERRNWSIEKTINTAIATAQCPICHQHPTDCICYSARFHRSLEVVTIWKPWKIEPAIKVITVNHLK